MVLSRLNHTPCHDLDPAKNMESCQSENAQPKKDLLNDFSIIRPELNLEKWQFWALSNSKSKTAEEKHYSRKKRVPGGYEIAELNVGCTEHGVLTTEDRKVYYALIRIWEEKGRPTGDVSFSLRRLARTLDKTWGSNIMDSLERSLNRLYLTPFTWKNAFHDAKTGAACPLIDDFTILSELRIYRQKDAKHTCEELGVFRFNEHLLNNLLRNYTKPLNFKVIKEFETDIAQLLYTHVDLIMHDKQEYFRLSQNVFQDLGIEGKTYRYRSNRKRTLAKALAELEDTPLSTGVLDAISLEKSADGTDFKIRFHKQPYAAPESQPVQRQQHEQPVQRRRKNQAVSNPQAEELVLDFHAELSHADHQPTQRELEQAAGLLESHGPAKARFIVSYALTEAPKTNFKMKTFGAVMQYTQDALEAYDRQARERILYHKQQQDLQLIVQQAEKKEQEEHARLDAFYQGLPEQDQTIVKARIDDIMQHKVKMTDPSEPCYTPTYQTVKYKVLQAFRTKSQARFMADSIF